jgi:hypothetical protein
VKAHVRYLINDTVQEISFVGPKISAQLYERDQPDHRGCRATIIVYDENDHIIETWQGSSVFTITKLRDHEDDDDIVICPTTGRRLENIATIDSRWVCCGGLYPDHQEVMT